jgi:hypothetical protein
MDCGIENAEALTRIFGRWPSFHDAEVVTLALDRRGDHAPVLIAQIHVWQTSGETDADGYYVRVDSTLVTLRFEMAMVQTLHGFNAQNVLSALRLERVRPHEIEPILREFLLRVEDERDWLRIHFDGIYGCDATFVCRSARVVSAEPYPLD